MHVKYTFYFPAGNDAKAMNNKKGGGNVIESPARNTNSAPVVVQVGDYRGSVIIGNCVE